MLIRFVFGITGFLLGFIVVVFIYPSLDKFRRMKSGYESARVISSIEIYVAENGIRPSAFEDIGLLSTDQVIVNWSIDLPNVDKYDIFDSVKPLSGYYSTYPHSEMDLSSLWETIQEVNDGAN
jgi:hypothetical protein